MRRVFPHDVASMSGFALAGGVRVVTHNARPPLSYAFKRCNPTTFLEQSTSTRTTMVDNLFKASPSATESHH